MQSSGGRFVLSYNGEIYNFPELRREMEQTGSIFRTTSDSEVLLEGYARWGYSVFERLDGMFALALFDTHTGNLLLARDRLGEKPLFYAHTTDYIGFSSEFRPLLSLPGVSREVSETSLYEYFALRYIPAPNTLFGSIHAVQPGVVCTISQDGSINERSFFAFDLSNQRGPYEKESYLDTLEEALVASIRSRLIADVPLGAWLSSGVDSSLVCALGARRLGKELHCYSAGFMGEEDETTSAEKIAEALGLPFTRYLITQDDLLSTISRFGTYLDEPNGDRSCVPTLLLSEQMRRQVTVALSGDGGDELFCGYGRYLGASQSSEAPNNPFETLNDYFSRLLPVFPWHQLDLAFPEQALNFRRRFLSRFTAVIARHDLNAFDRLRLVDLHSYLPGAVLAKVDRMSMRHALEVRTPFFSPAILATASRLPASLCASGGTLKLALRAVLARYLPDSLIRHDKRGFGMPPAFMHQHAEFFAEMARAADETLHDWYPFRDRTKAYDILHSASRANVNSYWAWIALGQWVDSNQSH